MKYLPRCFNAWEIQQWRFSHSWVNKFIYKTGKRPTDFLQTIIIPLEKKMNATECSDFRTISLLGHAPWFSSRLRHAAKVLIRVLTNRIEAKANAVNHIGKDEFGFRKGKGTRDAIVTLRVMGERCLQHGKDLCICFFDYEKAFDRVTGERWCGCQKILEWIGGTESWLQNCIWDRQQL